MAGSAPRSYWLAMGLLDGKNSGPRSRSRTTPVAKRQKPQPANGPGRPTKPPPDVAAARRIRHPEGLVVATHASAIRRRLKDDQEATGGNGVDRPPEAISGDFDTKPNLGVVPPDGFLDRGQLGLHLDDQQCPCRRVIREDVDGAALAVDGEGDLELHEPRLGAKQVRNGPNQERMSLVQEPVDCSSPPAHGRVEARINHSEHRPNRADRQPVEMTSFDQRYGRLPNVGGDRDIHLAQPAPTSKGPKQPSGTNVIHSVDRDSRRLLVAYPRNRTALNRSIGCEVAPSSARSARISPITGANLKPWPEQAEAYETPGTAG